MHLPPLASTPIPILALIHLMGVHKWYTLFIRILLWKIKVKKCCKNYVIVAMSIRYRYVVKLKFSFRFIFFKSKLGNSKLFSKLRLPLGPSERGSAGQIITDFIISNAQASWPLRPEYPKRILTGAEELDDSSRAVNKFDWLHILVVLFCFILI